MDIGQDQCRQKGNDEEDDVRRGPTDAAKNERIEVAVPMEVDACETPVQRRSEQATQVQQLEEGCVNARVEHNNESGSTAVATAASTGSGVGGSVLEQMPTVIGGRYVLHGKIDRGTFSTVKLATRRDEQHLHMEYRHLYAIKLITETSHPSRVEREIRCMAKMGGQCNVAEIVDVFRHQASVGLVMKYIPHEPFKLYFEELSPSEVQRYMKHLLIALAHVHRHGVIHRDVKPNNFLHCRRNGGTYMLVDFGLAQETGTGELSIEWPHDSGTNKRKDCKEQVKPRAVDAVASPQTPSVKRLKLSQAGNGVVSSATDPQTREQAVSINPLHKQQQHQPKAGSYTISPLKVSNNTMKDPVESPLARQIKSTAIGIGNGLKNRRLVSGSVATTATPAAVCSERENTLRDVGDSRRAKLAGTGLGADPKRNLGGCDCYGRAQVCTGCLVKPELYAPRAGTPGYRPPEVLLKYQHQTTAVDIWAAGVIFLSLLSKSFPFFENLDDMTSLAHIIQVFGFDRINQTARELDRCLKVADDTMRSKAFDLPRVCRHLRGLARKRTSTTGAPTVAPSGGSSPPPGVNDASNPEDVCDNCCRKPECCLCQDRAREAKDDRGTDECDEYGSAAYDLLLRMLETNPHRRITAADALKHPYFEVQY